MNPYLMSLYKVGKFGGHYKTLGSETKIWGKTFITIHTALPPRMTNEVSMCNDSDFSIFALFG